MRIEVPILRRRRGFLSALGTAAAGIAASIWVHGVLFWLAAGAAVVAVFIAVGQLVALSRWGPLQRRHTAFYKFGLVLFGLFLAVMIAEAFLIWREQGSEAAIQPANAVASHNTATGKLALVEKYDLPLKEEAVEWIIRRDGVLTLPAEWKRKRVKVPGATYSFVWHGVLHVHDARYFRRSTPFPEKRPDQLRIMVIGDSMTYGYGVDEKYIYPALIEDILNKKYRVEVLNLGVPGRESEDILKTLREFLPRLKPDLVVYGVVHNDFLPSQMGQYQGRGYKFPIPLWLEKYLVKRTRFARFVSEAYDASLRSLGLRKDFFTDILENYDGYQERFARDVAKMNEEVTKMGLPPMIALVLDQYPQLGGRGHKISRDAERHLNAAGMQVVSAEAYYRRYDGYALNVTLWEGHADEIAHAIWASMLLPAIEAQPILQRYRRAD